MSIEIRPHHALCAQFFVGKGYSEAFVNHMYRVLESLSLDGALVTLADGCDEICTACPNKHGEVCETEAKVRGIDRRAAEAMGLNPGDSLLWRDLCSLARQKIIDPGKLEEICCDCEWIGLCNGLRGGST